VIWTKPLFPLTIFVVTIVVEGRAQTPGVYLGDLSWPEAERRLAQSPLVILPFGAGAKEHGPHLPMHADRKVMEYLCQQAVDSLDVLVAPPILHGWFPAFRDYPGTEVRDPEVFTRFVLEVARSLVEKGAQRIVFLNTGITRATGLPIAIAAREIRVEMGTPTLVVSWDDLETDETDVLAEQRMGGHADELETSINLYLQPELVSPDLPPADYRENRQDYPISRACSRAIGTTRPSRRPATSAIRAWRPPRKASLHWRS
jgi:creatinine amidohydrolase